MGKGKKPQTGREALQWAASFFQGRGAMDKGQALLEARLLLAKAWNKEMIYLITNLGEKLPGEVWRRFAAFAARRADYEPLQYILGEQEFMSLSFKVTPAVLIPRSDTEVLVEEAIRLLKGRQAPKILDLGTGSGAIAVSLAYYLPEAQVWAVDISEDALAVARENASRHNVDARICFYHGDLFAPLPPQMKYDLIVSNPPYVGEAEYEELPADVKKEPVLALLGGEDGLEFYSRIAAQAPLFIEKGGALLLEIGWRQAEQVKGLLAENGFSPVSILPDLGGRDRVVFAGRSR